MRVGRRTLMAGAVLAVIMAAGITLWSLYSGPPSSAASGVCDDPGAQQEVDPPEAGPAPEVNLPASAVQTITTDLCAPWDLDFLPDGTALVTERDGWPEVEGDGNDARFTDPLAAWCPTSTAAPSGIATLGTASTSRACVVSGCTGWGWTAVTSRR
jgi:hypothetical protein